MNEIGELDSPAQRNYGVAFGIGRGEPSDEIGNTGARGRDGDAGLPRHASDAACDEGGVLLVPADNGLDLRVDEGIEDRVDLGAGNTECIVDTMSFQRPQDRIVSMVRLKQRLHAASGKGCVAPIKSLWELFGLGSFQVGSEFLS